MQACVLGDQGKRGVRDHHERQFAAHGAIGNQIFIPEFLHGFGDAGQFMVRVEIGFAESGKMFAAAENSSFGQSAQEFSGIDDYLLGVGGDGSRTHD